MKFVVFSFLLLAISSCALAHRDDAQVPQLKGAGDIIAALIRGIFDTVKQVIPDPLSLPNIGANITAPPLINGSFEVDDFLEIGIKQINLTDVNVAFLKTSLNFAVNIPKININANYMADLLLGSILPLYGSGPLNVHLKNLQFNLTSKFTFNPLKLLLQLKNTSLITTVDDATFDIHGMLNNEAFSILVCQIFDDTFKLFLNNHTELISKIASPIIENVINSFLNKKKTTTAIPTSKTTAIPTKETTAVPTGKTTARPTKRTTAIPTKKTTAVPTGKTTASPSKRTTAIPTGPTDFDDADFSEIADQLSEIDFSEIINEDKFKELGSLFLQTLKNHPDLPKAKLLMF